jgi:hypothetical protein
MRGKLLYLDEWVRVRNFMNKQFPKARGPCELCTKTTCGMVWFSIKSHQVRCTGCFDAETEHYRKMNEEDHYQGLSIRETNELRKQGLIP